MKFAIAVNKIHSRKEENFSIIKSLINEAAENGAELILFPEAAFTGLVNTDSPEKDLTLGESISGKYINELVSLSRELGIWIATGFFEIEDGVLYDSAVLISFDGRIVLKHRRTDSGWHSPKAPEEVYKEGSEHLAIETPFGRVAFLICGELFHDDALEQVKKLKPDILLVPMARSFYKVDNVQHWWDTDEKWFYLERLAQAKTNCLVANCLGDGIIEDSFGGAMAVDKLGNIIAELPLHKQGLLYVEIDLENSPQEQR
ncbi:hypothetical protein AT15_05715 [Kosmotoga arenicorallina S304]|uniref:CN hydrolase domain-containing protein n=1 Tax=Kosmotoga arenicorallina S304 TaxID=1453497 RepID=A0A176K2R0_9BACT|nr:carbon-nitrogen hydrolase family protein [Kosmotoga arenicorallina]OAA31570.1 hypothetical protein AT15_05715 [Kosmotoga arenicorallina S304]